VERDLAEAKTGENFQFERTGYFCLDPDSAPDKLVFNRTVSLRDSWAKIEGKQS
jgi:glutaminyl-tRNA synthetase